MEPYFDVIIVELGQHNLMKEYHQSWKVLLLHYVCFEYCNQTVSWKSIYQMFLSVTTLTVQQH